MAKKIIFTGRIDEFFDYKFGELEYRSLYFETQILNRANHQNSAVINYTDNETKYTRIIEYKHFEFGKQPNTVITTEFPLIGSKLNEPYYPLNSIENNAIYKQYEELINQTPNVIFGGRLAEYRYYDMHQVIASALNKVGKELLKN